MSVKEQIETIAAYYPEYFWPGVKETAQPEKDWDNPPHKSHQCWACDWVWRPSDVCTNGVAEIKTVGKVDNWGKPSMLALAAERRQKEGL